MRAIDFKVLWAQIDCHIGVSHFVPYPFTTSTVTYTQTNGDLFNPGAALSRIPTPHSYRILGGTTVTRSAEVS